MLFHVLSMCYVLLVIFVCYFLIVSFTFISFCYCTLFSLLSFFQGCVEMAWMMGMIRHHNGPLPAGPQKGTQYAGWVDAETQLPVQDTEVKAKYEERILKHSGIRLIGARIWIIVFYCVFVIFLSLFCVEYNVIYVCHLP